VSIWSWLTRKVTVEQVHPDYPNVTRIIIDEKNGSTPQELLLNKHNLFSVAWVCRKASKVKGFHDISLIVEFWDKAEGIPGEKSIKIPNWARRSVFAKVEASALAQGWDGDCPPVCQRPIYR